MEVSEVLAGREVVRCGSPSYLRWSAIRQRILCWTRWSSIAGRAGIVPWHTRGFSGCGRGSRIHERAGRDSSRVGAATIIVVVRVRMGMCLRLRWMMSGPIRFERVGVENLAHEGRLRLLWQIALTGSSGRSCAGRIGRGAPGSIGIVNDMSNLFGIDAKSNRSMANGEFVNVAGRGCGRNAAPRMHLRRRRWWK